MQYNLLFEFKTGDLFPGVHDLENTMNGFMADFGFHEQLFFKSHDVPCMVLEVDLELDAEAKRQVVEAVNKIIEERDMPMRCTGIEKRFENVRTLPAPDASHQ
jgi:hypothetical protein